MTDLQNIVITKQLLEMKTLIKVIDTIAEILGFKKQKRYTTQNINSRSMLRRWPESHGQLKAGNSFKNLIK